MANYVDRGLKKIGITISKPMLAAVCMVAGIMVVLFPSLVVWIVGLFLVVQGGLLLTDFFEQEKLLTAMTTMPAKGVTAAVKSIQCRSCGAENARDAVYCKKCGKELAPTTQIITPNLQRSNPVIAK